MATNNTLKTQMQEASKQMRPEDASIDQLLNSVEIKNKFETILNKRAPQFIASIFNNSTLNRLGCKLTTQNQRQNNYCRNRSTAHQERYRNNSIAHSSSLQ